MGEEDQSTSSKWHQFKETFQKVCAALSLILAFAFGAFAASELVLNVFDQGTVWRPIAVLIGAPIGGLLGALCLDAWAIGAIDMRSVLGFLRQK